VSKFSVVLRIRKEENISEDKNRSRQIAIGVTEENISHVRTAISTLRR
jgi:hypothetical protein